MEYFEPLFLGLLLTLKIAFSSLIFGLIFSFIFLHLLISRNKFIFYPTNIFLNVIRGVPEILIIFFIYYGADFFIKNILDISAKTNPAYAGIFSLALLFSCYVSQVFYDANKKIDDGQIKVAQLLGLNVYAIFWHVKLHQFLRYAIPGVSNYWLVLLKDTALLSLIGMQDFFSQTQAAAKNTNNYFYYYIAALIVYLFLTAISESFCARIKNSLEKPWKIT